MKRIKKADKKAQSTPKQYKPIYSFNKNIFFASFITLITFFISIIFIPEKQNLTMLGLNRGIFYFISLIFSIIIFFCFFLSEKPKIRKANKYLFLFLILYSIGISFLQYTSLPVKNNTLYYQLLTLQKYLITQTSVIGIIFLWQHKKKLNKIINKQFTEKEHENKRQFFEIIQNLFTKKEILSTSIFFIVIGISIFTLFYRLDYFDIYSDEVQVTKAATGYYYTGEYKQWDFIKDEVSKAKLNRAKPHLFLVAQSYKLFGINTWAARFPSALFSVLLIIFLFFIGKFFVKDKTTVLLVILSFALYYDFLALGRWSRMYAIVFPLFILSFYWAFKFVTEYNSLTIFKSGRYKLLSNYFNFNYIYLPFLLILLFLNLKIHQNTTLVFPVFLIFSIFSTFLFFKEKKYITASIIAIGILVNQIINPYKVGFTRFTFFEIDHVAHYSKILFGYPFSELTNIIFLIVGFSILIFVKNDIFRKKYLYLFILSLITWVLFSYIFDYASHYRYVSFATPITVLLIIGTFILISKLYSKYIQVLLVLLVVLYVSIHFAKNYNNLYITNSISPARPSIAHKSIVKNYKKGDVIFRHYGPKRYMQGIDKNTKFINFGSSKGRNFSEIFEQLKKYNSGWITWHSYFAGQIDKRFIKYVNLYFKKYNGYGIDNTGEEVFYYNNEMLHSMEEFNSFENLPVANLKQNHSYSLAFTLKVNNINSSVYTISGDSSNILCKVSNSNLIIKSNKNDSLFVKIIPGINNNLIWFQDVKKEITTQGIYLNEKLITSIDLATTGELIKFKINPFFTGNIDKIRLYDFVLNQKQAKAITKNNNYHKASEALSANEKEFTTLFLWQKQ